jgi:hypothetical protein
MATASVSWPGAYKECQITRKLSNRFSVSPTANDLQLYSCRCPRPGNRNSLALDLPFPSPSPVPCSIREYGSCLAKYDVQGDVQGARASFGVQILHMKQTQSPVLFVLALRPNVPIGMIFSWHRDMSRRVTFINPVRFLLKRRAKRRGSNWEKSETGSSWLNWPTIMQTRATVPGG